MGALVTAAVIGAGTALYGANKQAKAAERGADAQSQAAADANAEGRRQFDINQANQQPFLDAGKNALGLQQKFLSGDTSGFENSAQYKFAVDQGFKGLNRGLAAQGAFGAPAADADRIALGQGLATQYADNYWAKLAGQAGQGYNAAANLGTQGLQSADMIGGNLLAGGNARANGYAGSANAWSNAANSLGQIGGAVAGYFGQQQPQQAQAPVNWLGGSQLGGNSQWAQTNFPQGGFMGRTS